MEHQHGKFLGVLELGPWLDLEPGRKGVIDRIGPRSGGCIARRG
jgi:hypothetical protein